MSRPQAVQDPAPTFELSMIHQDHVPSAPPSPLAIAMSAAAPTHHQQQQQQQKRRRRSLFEWERREVREPPVRIDAEAEADGRLSIGYKVRHVCTTRTLLTCVGLTLLAGMLFGFLYYKTHRMAAEADQLAQHAYGSA